MFIKIMLLLLSFLNLFDASLTAYGLHQEIIKEKNPIALALWEIHPLLFLGLKIILSLFLFFFFIYDIKNNIIKKWKTTFWKWVLIVLNIFYLYITAKHIIWVWFFIQTY